MIQLKGLVPWKNPNLGEGRIFSHFTNAEGFTGITGIFGERLNVDQPVIVNTLTFGKGSNSFYAQKPGDIFITDLGFDATAGNLEQIGVFGEKQKFVIQFSEETALIDNNIRVLPVKIRQQGSIYTIPAQTTFSNGKFLVMRVRP
ncbi:conserved hypothetical protein [Planktothrix serta PCC 8927]|uniref:Uncharacterized protein n=1 Tax=Planktothrix serta PCC 8927 TaxID=671068 RepID=A0A7Z9BPZ6_9CYAN|nr:hypothetical protein [Planktothrix serta]VXD17088.1 conserved hypothetical protein [Planktothrix serta PCC 8927]